MRLNLMEYSEELAEHRKLVQGATDERLCDYSVLVETPDTPGVYDVLTPLQEGGFVTVGVNGILVIMDAITGEQS
jgi:hypothetical protein